MIGFIVILTIFGILTLVIYLPVIIQYFVAKHAERLLDSQTAEQNL